MDGLLKCDTSGSRCTVFFYKKLVYKKVDLPSPKNQGTDRGILQNPRKFLCEKLKLVDVVEFNAKIAKRIS